MEVCTEAEQEGGRRCIQSKRSGLSEVVADVQLIVTLIGSAGCHV